MSERRAWSKNRTEKTPEKTPQKAVLKTLGDDCIFRPIKRYAKLGMGQAGRGSINLCGSDRTSSLTPSQWRVSNPGKRGLVCPMREHPRQNGKR